jgi:ribonucleotide reductase alpha subunit
VEREIEEQHYRERRATHHRIPAEIREKYKTVWEMGMVSLIDMAADRGAFICQSQFELVGKPQLQQPDVHAFFTAGPRG